MASPLSEDPELRRLVREVRRARKFPSKLRQLLSEYEAKFGEEANDAAHKIAAEDTLRIWASIAKDKGSNNLEDLLDSLWEPFLKSGGQCSIERFDSKIEVQITRCPVAEVYRMLGKEDLGMLFHCNTDSCIAEGFNPEIKFSMAESILSGDRLCHQIYSLKDA